MPTLLPSEVQSYIRHILHIVGMMIVGYSGHDGAMVEAWVGILVNAISLAWFIAITVKNHKKK